MSKHFNATHYENIPAFPKNGDKSERVVHAVMETVKGSSHKFALQSEFGIIWLKESLPDGMTWPYDYGFIPQTVGDDGDPIDVLYLVDAPTFPGCMVKARLLGAFRMKKNGVENDRLIGAAMPAVGRTQSTDRYHELADLSPQLLEEIERFLVTYSTAQGNTIEVLGRVNAREAMGLVKSARKKFQKNGAH